MNRTTFSLAVMTAASLAANVGAQVFNSGSSGAMGDVVITSNTVWAIPNNGQFHVNTLVIDPDVTLSFRKPTNGLNPPVYILARSNVTIHGSISVDAQHGGQALAFSEGGPGGFNGGGAGHSSAGIQPGDGQGPGRGVVGQVGGSFGTRARDAYWQVESGGPTYGNLLLLPLIGGSGGPGVDGNPGHGGGGGGGAILVASDTQIELGAAGRIFARGGNSTAIALGSGGAVRLVAPTIVGNGVIDVSGGISNPWYSGGAGRARIDCRPQPIFISVAGVWRIGRNPVIFAPNAPRLDIVHAAGQDIPQGTNSSVLVTLPSGSLSSQMVTLKATNFSGEFDAFVETTPENGSSERQTFRWNVGNNSVATTNVTVNIPGNTPTRITAWAEVLF